jgi:hypothetical protein
MWQIPTEQRDTAGLGIKPGIPVAGKSPNLSEQ